MTRTLLSTIVAIILCTALSACGEHHKQTPPLALSRDPGPAPSYADDYRFVRAPRAGENAIEREKVARDTANHNAFIACAVDAEWTATRAAMLAGWGAPATAARSPVIICREARRKAQKMKKAR